MIAADCIESTEFPDLAGKYQVYAVPKTVINEKTFLEGALPESFFLEGILKAIEQPPEAGPAPPSTAP